MCIMGTAPRIFFTKIHPFFISARITEKYIQERDTRMKSVKEQAKNSTLTILWSIPKNPREAIKEIFTNSLVKKMQEFKPEFVFISAGFDAHIKDPLGGFNLTTQDFVDLTNIVKKIAVEHAGGV